MHTDIPYEVYKTLVAKRNCNLSVSNTTCTVLLAVPKLPSSAHLSASNPNTHNQISVGLKTTSSCEKPRNSQALKSEENTRQDF